MPERAYVLKGDPALVADALQRLLGELRAAGLDVEELGGDDLTAGSVVEACNAYFLGGADKAVVVRDAEVHLKAADDLRRLSAYLADPNTQTSLVLVLAGEHKKLVDVAKKAGAAVIDPTPPGQAKARGGWLAERLASGPVRLDRQAASRLGVHLGEDLGRLPGILEVLAAAHGEGATITAADLDPVLGEQGGGAPWDLTDAIDGGDAGAALHHLHRLLHLRHPFVVFASLWGHYQRILRLEGSGARNEAQAAAVLNMKGSTFPARKAMAQAARLGPGGVARAVELLHRADLDLRGLRTYGPGRHSERITLEVLVARLARLTPTRR
ncbi:MAG: DNA polymerase III subunit delta [Acidimicrobiales bacterium]